MGIGLDRLVMLIKQIDDQMGVLMQFLEQRSLRAQRGAQHGGCEDGAEAGNEPHRTTFTGRPSSRAMPFKLMVATRSPSFKPEVMGTMVILAAPMVTGVKGGR